jgi:hypothetical protein
MEVPADPDHHGSGGDGRRICADRRVELTPRTSAVEVENPIGYLGDGGIVARDHDARSSVDHRTDQLEHGGDVAAILMARWLVGEQNDRLDDRGAAQRHSLLLTDRPAANDLGDVDESLGCFGDLVEPIRQNRCVVPAQAGDLQSEFPFCSPEHLCRQLPRRREQRGRRWIGRVVGRRPEP